MRSHLIAVAAVTALVFVLSLAGPVVNQTTVALCLLLVVLFAARNLGGAAAVTASVASMLAFNFFFLPPTGTLTIADPFNLVALAAFLAVALTVGELSSRAHRRAEEAEASRLEVQRLYAELKDAFERSADAEALRRSDQLKSALLDAVTHDLRTPLTSIKASITALIEAPATLDEAGRHELLDVVNEEADRLDRIIGDLVSLARVEAGVGLESRWCALDEVARAALARVGAEASRVRLLSPPEPPAIMADARAIEEVWVQLLQNALRCAPGDSPVTVEIAAREGVAEVRFEDEGPGVPVADRDRIFEKFYRGAGGRPGSLGLGLAIARGIVLAHGGSINVTDRRDGRRGAAFVVRLPMGDDERS